MSSRRMAVRLCVWGFLTVAIAVDPVTANEREAASEGHTFTSVIIGGGIAGLTAAYKLKTKDILVLEKWPQVGGRVWEGEYKGFSYARGAEYLGEPEGVLKKIISHYDLKPIEIMYPSLCHFNDDVPGYENTDIYNGFDGIALMHVMEDGGDTNAVMNFNRFMQETTQLVDRAYDAGGLPHRFDFDHPVAAYDDVTMREWFVERGFGPTYQDKWNAHIRGLFGASMDEVSILMAISELGWEYYGEEPIEMPDESWNERVTGLYHEEAYSFLGGLSEVPRAIAGDPKLAGKIRTNAEVTSVKIVRGSSSDNTGEYLYEVQYKDRKNHKEFTVKTRSIIMAVPADIALKIASEIITGQRREIMEGITYCEYLTVNLISEEPIQDFTFELSTSDDFWAVAFYDSLWVQKSEDPKNPLNDEVFITSAYIAGNTCGEQLVGFSDEEILSKTYDDLEKIFPGASSKVREFKINRFKHGYPLMGRGAYRARAQLNELNGKDPRTFILVGDYMALPTMEAAMAQAAYAVKRLKLK